jgi:hypothetical protein
MRKRQDRRLSSYCLNVGDLAIDFQTKSVEQITAVTA